MAWRIVSMLICLLFVACRYCCSLRRLVEQRALSAQSFALQLKQQQHRSCLALYNSRLGLLRLEVKGVLGRM